MKPTYVAEKIVEPEQYLTSIRNHLQHHKIGSSTFEIPRLISKGDLWCHNDEDNCGEKHRSPCSWCARREGAG